MSEALTLYDIETDLLNLMQCRESLLTVDDGCTPAEREVAVKECEAAIQQRVTDLVKKVDGAAFYLREFEVRALTAKAEKQRLSERERMWEARRQRLEGYIIAVMQTMGQTRLEGDSNTLKLAKNPPSVEIAQPELVPEEYRMVEIRMPLEIWRILHSHLYAEDIDPGPISEKPSVSKSKIAEALKQLVPCSICEGVGVREVYAGHGDKRDEKCAACKGTGKVKQGVPGCSLVKDKVRLEVS